MNDPIPVVDLDSLPPLSEGTRAAIANLVDYAIERKRGEDVGDEAGGATMLALAGLRMDLRAYYLDAGYANACVDLGAFTRKVLDVLVESATAARRM